MEKPDKSDFQDEIIDTDWKQYAEVLEKYIEFLEAQAKLNKSIDEYFKNKSDLIEIEYSLTKEEIIERFNDYLTDEQRQLLNLALKKDNSGWMIMDDPEE